MVVGDGQVVGVAGELVAGELGAGELGAVELGSGEPGSWGAGSWGAGERGAGEAKVKNRGASQRTSTLEHGRPRREPNSIHLYLSGVAL